MYAPSTPAVVPACGSTRTLPALVLGLFAAFASASPSFAQVLGYSGGMGTVTVEGRQYYRLSFRPDIPMGNWGLALDIELFTDEDGNFSDRGWRFGSATETFDTFLRKLYYVRYAQPREDTYFKVGALDEVTLGYGLIMRDYRNTLEYPGIKKTGLQFHFRNRGTMALGVEGVVNNIQDFQEGGPVLGMRLSARPAGNLEVGLIYVLDVNQYSGLLDGDNDGFPDAVDAFPSDKNRLLDNDGDGAVDRADVDDDNDGVIDIDPGSGLPADVIHTLRGINSRHGDQVFPLDDDVSRKNPFNKDAVDGDRFGIVGLDLAHPIIDGESLDLRLYTQLAFLHDDDDELSPNEAETRGVAPGNRKAEGMGIAIPGLYLATGPLVSQLEFRHFRGDFDSAHFDNLYDLDRARLDLATGRATTKDSRLRRDDSASGVYGRLGTDLGSVVTAVGDYQYLAGGGDPKQQLHAQASLSPQLLRNVPRLAHAQAFYQKNNIGTRPNKNGDPGSRDAFFESTEDTFYGYAIVLEMAGGVSIYWDTRFVFERDADGRLEREKIMIIEIVFNF